jgi:hypothetical protein
MATQNLAELMSSESDMINADVAAKILGCSPQRLRMMARERPERLGFPVCCPTPHRVKIPRIPFMRFLGLEVHDD